METREVVKKAKVEYRRVSETVNVELKINVKYHRWETRGQETSHSMEASDKSVPGPSFTRKAVFARIPLTDVKIIPGSRNKPAAEF